MYYLFLQRYFQVPWSAATTEKESEEMRCLRSKQNIQCYWAVQDNNSCLCLQNLFVSKTICISVIELYAVQLGIN